MLTLRGTPFLYNGEEIGMRNLYLDDPARFRDILSDWLYAAETQEFGYAKETAVQDAAEFGRDKCRTPMQWRPAPNAGFSPPGVETWLPVHPDYAQGVNVADQEADPESLLSFYRRFLRLRRRSPALQLGDYTQLAPEHPHVLAFRRSAPGQTCLVALNMSPEEQTVELPGSEGARVIFSTGGQCEGISPLKLAPHEVWIGELPL